MAVLSATAFLAVALPGPSGYSRVLDWLRHRMEIRTEPRFDRVQLNADLVAAGFKLGDPAHVRIYKRERRLELWMQRAGEARYALFRSYAICNVSGGLGPKLEEGDRQAPEGFYRIARAQLNPASRHHLAFNLGFPNAFDRQLERTGSALMVHGGCSSIGCYAITDESVDEVYAVVEAAMDAGQDEVDVAAFPFEMSDWALSIHGGTLWESFWRNLKQGADLFALTGAPPKVAACKGEYRFGGDADSEGCVPITGWV